MLHGQLDLGAERISREPMGGKESEAVMRLNGALSYGCRLEGELEYVVKCESSFGDGFAVLMSSSSGHDYA